MAGIKPELWEKTLQTQYYEGGAWINEIPEKSQYVNQGTVNLRKLEVEPEVYFNNGNAEIGVQRANLSNKPISLVEVDTQNTEITDSDLKSWNVDVIKPITEIHKNSLLVQTRRQGAHSIAPQSNTTNTPIIEAAGQNDHLGFARLTANELAGMRESFFSQNVDLDMANLLCLLHPTHARQLATTDEAFAKQWVIRETGKPISVYGWKFYEYNGNPVYDAATKEKIAFGSVNTGLVTSLLFNASECVKALGWDGSNKRKFEMYHSKAKENPRTRATEVGFKTWWLCSAKGLRQTGAITSAKS